MLLTVFFMRAYLITILFVILFVLAKIDDDEFPTLQETGITNAEGNAVREGDNIRLDGSYDKDGVKYQGKDIVLDQSGNILSASYLKVGDVEFYNTNNIQVTDNSITAESGDKVVVGSLTAYDFKGFEYSDDTVSFSSASHVNVREYHFPNVQDATFVLNGDGSLQSVDLIASKKTDYILPNPLWLPFAANIDGLRRQNSVYTDMDGDGVSDYVENTLLQRIDSRDTDQDGLSDAEELAIYLSDPRRFNYLFSDMNDSAAVEYILANNVTEINGVRIDQYKDTDNDGVSDYAETILKLNKTNADTDGDGLSDYDEMLKHGTNPLLADTDGDGIPDGSDPFPLINLKQGITGENVLADENIIIKADGGESFHLDFMDGVSFRTEDDVSFGIGSDKETLGIHPIETATVSMDANDGLYEFVVTSAVAKMFGEELEINSSASFSFDTLHKVNCFDIKAPGRYKYLGANGFGLFAPVDHFYACVRKTAEQRIKSLPDKDRCSQCGYFEIGKELWFRGVLEYEKPGILGTYEDAVQSLAKNQVTGEDWLGIIGKLMVKGSSITTYSGRFWIEESDGRRYANTGHMRADSVREYNSDNLDADIVIEGNTLMQIGKNVVRIYGLQ
jgi:hypothetical protein